MWRETNSDEDRELVLSSQQGDEAAFEKLVRKYQQTLLNLVYHNVGYRADVEDVVQKIFAKVYFSLGKFDSSRPFFPWLYRIAVNQCYDELRRVRRSRTLTFTDLSLEETESVDKLISQASPAPAPEEERKDLHALLLSMLDRLPAQQRMAVAMRDLEDVPYETIAQTLNCSEQAARLKVFRARTRLRDLMLKSLRRRKGTAVP